MTASERIRAAREVRGQDFNHDSEDHDWESCQECVEQAKQDEILGPDAVPHGTDENS